MYSSSTTSASTPISSGIAEPRAAGDERRFWHALLMTHSQNLPNDEVLACLLASHLTGLGALPPSLGLGAEDFRRLMVRHFPGAELPARIFDQGHPVDREAERDELIRLMLAYRAGVDASEAWIARIVAAGCMAADHLWQDLGLWSRLDLTEMLRRNFPALAARNDRDMKWKKFLYKQLCMEEGIYTCRAPSCEVCADYADCFGPED